MHEEAHAGSVCVFPRVSCLDGIRLDFEIARHHVAVMIVLDPLMTNEWLEDWIKFFLCKLSAGEWEHRNPPDAPHVISLPTAAQVFQKQLTAFASDEKPVGLPLWGPVIMQHEHYCIMCFLVLNNLYEVSVEELPTIMELTQVWAKKENSMLPKAHEACKGFLVTTGLDKLEVAHLLAGLHRYRLQYLMVARHCPLVAAMPKVTARSTTVLAASIGLRRA
mmetsp:Transcript_93607/g.260616  ORF Transcript_93607/g.260616 Transcript_93607/m.260616 type:complete len:220 (+) Transcript_93607:1783-2442(+)